MWSTPEHGTCSEWCSLNVCASRKSSRWSRSATTIAYRPSGVKYMLYGSSTGIVRPGLAGARVDRRERVAAVVRDVQRLQVPRRHDVLRQPADGEVLDDLERALVDHVDGVAVAVRDVDERPRAPRTAAEVADAVGRVDVPDAAACVRCARRGRRRHELGRGRDGRRRAAAAGEQDAARRLATAARSESGAAERPDRARIRSRPGRRRRCAPSACRAPRRGRRSRRRRRRSPLRRRASSARAAGRSRVTLPPSRANA